MVCKPDKLDKQKQKIGCLKFWTALCNKSASKKPRFPFQFQCVPIRVIYSVFVYQMAKTVTKNNKNVRNRDLHWTRHKQNGQPISSSHQNLSDFNLVGFYCCRLLNQFLWKPDICLNYELFGLLTYRERFYQASVKTRLRSNQKNSCKNPHLHLRIIGRKSSASGGKVNLKNCAHVPLRHTWDCAYIHDELCPS